MDTTHGIPTDQAAALLHVDEDALRVAAEAGLVPHARTPDGDLTFTLEHLTAITGRQPTPTRPDGTVMCCIDRDPEGRQPYCRACAARVVGVTPKTLANWAAKSEGPTNIGRPGKPRYRRADLIAWLSDGQAAA